MQAIDRSVEMAKLFAEHMETIRWVSTIRPCKKRFLVVGVCCKAHKEIQRQLKDQAKRAKKLSPKESKHKVLSPKWWRERRYFICDH